MNKNQFISASISKLQTAHACSLCLKKIFPSRESGPLPINACDTVCKNWLNQALPMYPSSIYFIIVLWVL
jgi:hypothetical protein